MITVAAIHKLINRHRNQSLSRITDSHNTMTNFNISRESQCISQIWTEIFPISRMKHLWRSAHLRDSKRARRHSFKESKELLHYKRTVRLCKISAENLIMRIIKN